MKSYKAKENFTDNGGHNILIFFLFYQIFLLPQVKLGKMVYDLPQKLPNDLRLSILGIRNFQEDLKTAWNC